MPRVVFRLPLYPHRWDAGLLLDSIALTEDSPSLSKDKFAGAAWARKK